MTIIIGLGTESDPGALQLQTRAKRFIRNAVRPEMSPDVMKERSRVLLSAYPALKPISASAIYNCYGMVFASRRTCVLYEEDVLALLADDGYRKLPWDASKWCVGDVVVYRNRNGELAHVGMIARVTPDLRMGEIEVDVLSTWGESGEFLHPINIVSPLLGTASAVMSQRFLYDS